MMKLRWNGTNLARRWLAGGVLALPLLGWAQVVQTADLVANISKQGQSTAAVGEVFTYTVTLSNNGPSAAGGAAFTVTLPQGAVGVAASCNPVTEKNGAKCPVDLVVSAPTPQPITIKGTVPALPDQGAVEITVTGTYGIGSPTSVASSVAITPPAGVTEVYERSNTNEINTTLITDAKLVVNKTQSITNGVVTYTVTVKNEGNASADGARFVDALETATNTDYAANRAAVDATFVSCRADGGAACPANNQFRSFSNSTDSWRRLLFDTTVPKLPSGGSLTVVYQAVIRPSTQCGMQTSNLTNKASITPPGGITNQFGTASSSAVVSVPGTAACPPKPVWDYGLTKTQAKVLPDGTTAPIAQSGAPYTYGDTIRYTITVVNNSDTAADGAMLRDWTTATTGTSADYANLKARYVSCTAENQAECPAAGSFPAIDRAGGLIAQSNIGDLFNVAIPKFPSKGKITIAYDVVLAPSQLCGWSPGSFWNDASIQPPPGSVGFTGKQVGSVGLAVPKSADCPNIQITKTQSTTTPQPGVPFEYVVTITNNGPGAADGARWGDYMRTSGFAENLKAKLAYDRCVAAGGAQCPSADQFAAWDSQSLSGFNNLVKSGTTIPKLPAQGKITLHYQVTLEELTAASCSSAQGTITNYTYVSPPLNPYRSINAQVDMPITCADVGITKTVDPIFVKAGKPMVYSVEVSNAGLGAVANVLFSDPLPSIFEYESATCEMVQESKPALPHPRTECGDPSTIVYDKASHKLSSTIASLGQLGVVKFTIKGKAGSVPGTYKNEAFAILPAGVFDPIMKTNRTDVNVQIENTQSTITVKKLVEGLPAAGLPQPMTLTGTVTCGVQAPQTWSITVPAGATSGTSAPLVFYDTEVCTVTEDTPLPAAPVGYEWSGTPVIANSTEPLGPQTSREVLVTNTLARQTASLELTKLLSGPSEAVRLVRGNFRFALDCGVDGKFTAEVDIANGAERWPSRSQIC